MRSAALSSFLMSRPSWPRRCSRSGSYGIARLAGKYSAEIGLTEPVAHLAAAASYRSRATLRWSAAALISPTSGALRVPPNLPIEGRPPARGRLFEKINRKRLRFCRKAARSQVFRERYPDSVRIRQRIFLAWALCALISAGKGVGSRDRIRLREHCECLRNARGLTKVTWPVIGRQHLTVSSWRGTENSRG